MNDMEIMITVFFVVCGLFVIFVISKIVKANSSIKNVEGNQLKDYRAKHPECDRDGKIYCYNCNVNNIYIKQLSQLGGHMYNAHICRQCGQLLYKSKSSALV